MAENERRAWERLDAEGARAFAAFVVYYQQGPQRSLQRVASDLHKTTRQMEMWSAKHNWVARAKAYDDYQTMLMLEDRKAEHKNKINVYKLRREQLANAAFNLAGRYLDRLKLRLERLTDDEIAEIPPETLPVCLKTAALLANIALDNQGHSLAVEELMQALEIGAVKDE